MILFSNQYKEVKSDTNGIYKEKGSKFISYVFSVYSEKDVKKKLEYIKKTEKSANHYCYACIINFDKSCVRFSDDGEPSSTAGKPILGVIKSNDLTNILIIVVRYFGGKKLGISGLIRSYKNASIDAINNNTIITKEITDMYSVKFRYDYTSDVMRLLKRYNVLIEKIIKSNTNCKVIFAIRRADADDIVKKLNYLDDIIIKYIKTK